MNSDRILDALHMAWVLGIIVAVAGMVWIERDVDRIVRAVPADYLRQTIYVIGGTATDLEKTLKAERQASADQLKAAAISQQKMNTLLDQGTQFLLALGKTNDTLNAGLADQQRQLDQLEADADASIKGLTSAEQQLDRVLAGAGDAAASAAQLAADPALKDSLGQLDAAMGQADQTLQQIQQIAASGNRDAQMLEARLRQALKPASLAKNLFERALGIAGPAAQVATAVK